MKKINIKSVLFILFFMVVGGFLGIFIGMMTDGGNITPIDLLLVATYFILSIVLHIIIHEAGHLVMGLLTGYTFLSFRIFSWVLVKQHNKIKLTKQKVPGTLGQCLLIPPEREEFIYKLYLLGGVLFNFLASLLMISLISVFPVFTIVFSGIGCVLGLMNLIPTGFNDGNTLKLANSSIENQELLFLQLDVNSQMMVGKKFTELPNDYFSLIAENPKHSYFNDFQEFLILGKGIEKRNWVEVATSLKKLWENLDSLILPYQLELKKEMFYYLLIRKQEDEKLTELLKDKHLHKYLNMKTISNKRVLATKAYFYDQDLEKSFELINEGLLLKEKTSNLGEFLVESDNLVWLKEQIADMEANKLEKIN